MNSIGSLSVTIQREFPGYSLDIAFESNRGVTALLGPSGAGKTLTLRAIAGLLRPSRGRITLHNRVLFDAAHEVDIPARDRRVGLIFQQYALFPHLTVAENVAYGLHGQPRNEREARAHQMLELVGLVDLAARLPRALSGGQQQRVALARSLAPQPSLLLLDEPLAALDAPLRQRLGAELRALHERTGVPMVLVTHDPAEASRIADATVYIEGGRVTPLSAFPAQ
jgi:ABC-type sulfate/molybdate transport systems ATPase subunit